MSRPSRGALRRRDAGPARLLALALAWGAGCAPAPVDLVPHLDVARTVVSSGEVFPGQAAGSPELPVGWAGGEGEVIQIVDGSADLELRVAGPGDHLLAVEIQGPDAGMVILASVEGNPAGSIPVPPGWNEVEIPLSGALLRHGTNRVRLDLTAVDGDARLGSRVALRRIRLVEPDGRTPWPGRPGVAQAVGDGPLQMPAGSAVDLVARLPVGTAVRAAGRVARPAGSRRASLRIGLEALGPGDEMLATAWHQADTEGAFELALEIPDRAAPATPTGGDEVLLRWRVEGPGNGTVTWSRMEIVGPDAGFVPVPDRSRPLAPPRRQAALAGRDVVLVLLDAARRDAVSAYGGHPPTPAIDGLAGSRVEHATAAAPWTAPSVASMMTGLYPDAHGLQAWNAAIPKSVRSLGESFAAAGYRTMFFTQHPVWGAIPTLRRGFEVQQQVPETERQRLPTAADLFGHDDRAAFALVHLLLPHDPYEPPPPYRGSLTDDGGRDRLDVDSEALHDLRRERPHRAQVPTAELRRYARARYDETMLWTDALVGELVHRIDASERDPLIVLLSDHGEGFYEHGWFLHTRSVHEEMLAVPLLFRWPRDVAARGVADAGPVSTVDLMPTLVDLLGLPYEGPGMHGRSLAPWLLEGIEPGERPGPTYGITARVEIGEPWPQIAFHDGTYKVLLDERSGRIETYDLAADPGETVDLSRDRPLLAQWLLQGLAAQRLANRRILAAWRDAGQTTELSPETIERLRALGYLR